MMGKSDYIVILNRDMENEMFFIVNEENQKTAIKKLMDHIKTWKTWIYSISCDPVRDKI